LAAPGCAFFLEIIPNVKGKPKIKDKIKDKRGALTAVRQVRILHRELKISYKLARHQLNEAAMRQRALHSPMSLRAS
jgi:hypothetical protein